jgi:hypothetical protein
VSGISNQCQLAAIGDKKVSGFGVQVSGVGRIGKMEFWNTGMLGLENPIIPSSIIPLLHHSIVREA